MTTVGAGFGARVGATVATGFAVALGLTRVGVTPEGMVPETAAVAVMLSVDVRTLVGVKVGVGLSVLVATWPADRPVGVCGTAVGAVVGVPPSA